MTKKKSKKTYQTKRSCYIKEVSRSGGWNTDSEMRDRTAVEHLVSVTSGMNADSVEVVLDHLFGNEGRDVTGAIPKLLNSGFSVDIEGFGVFGHRMRKERITHDVCKPGNKVYTPACSTVSFKPSTRLRWNQFMASVAAHMPDEPLPEGMRFSQRIEAMSVIKEWKKKMGEKKEGIDEGRVIE